jgi:hypothetical protein
MLQFSELRKKQIGRRSRFQVTGTSGLRADDNTGGVEKGAATLKNSIPPSGTRHPENLHTAAVKRYGGSQNDGLAQYGRSQGDALFSRENLVQSQRADRLWCGDTIGVPAARSVVLVEHDVVHLLRQNTPLNRA